MTPNENCCACKELAAQSRPPQSAANACKDTPGFVDKYGGTCKDYQAAGNHPSWCLNYGNDGDFGMTPNKNCCVCKAIAATVQQAVSASKSPMSGPSSPSKSEGLFTGPSPPNQQTLPPSKQPTLRPTSLPIENGNLFNGPSPNVQQSSPPSKPPTLRPSLLPTLRPSNKATPKPSVLPTTSLPSSNAPMDTTLISSDALADIPTISPSGPPTVSELNIISYSNCQSLMYLCYLLFSSLPCRPSRLVSHHPSLSVVARL